MRGIGRRRPTPAGARPWLHRLLLAGLAALLAACAHAPRRDTAPLPELALAPAAFDGTVSLAQRLTFARLDGRSVAAHPLDALLEIDAGAVRLAALALSRRILSLTWDGKRLDVDRDPQLPPQVDPARVLRDVQLVLWPAAAIRAALPAGWTLREAERQRELLHGERVAVAIRYATASRWAGEVVLENRHEGYRLTIASHEQAP